ncbi:hypothetical protein [Phenylobacterium sp.]|uniref:hypothetical protein n=1 Tax=Phenylobacterium sp. TaxID=1871053 RepID=UPI002F95AF6A
MIGHAAAVNPIRPVGLAPTAPAAPAPKPDAARSAGQRAFFEMIAGKSPAAAAAPSASAETSAATPRPERLAAAAGEPPTKILRPGSLLDIRI